MICILLYRTHGFHLAGTRPIFGDHKIITFTTNKGNDIIPHTVRRDWRKYSSFKSKSKVNQIVYDCHPDIIPRLKHTQINQHITCHFSKSIHLGT